MNDHEPLSNIGMVCPDHAPRPGKFTGQAPRSFVGKFVKLAFKGKNPRTGDAGLEHMWVQVKYAIGDKLKGKLANEPVSIMSYKHGDTVDFSVSEIEQVSDVG
jgi:uncharacterized protein YegJ (DUF2314 family)